jgi:hypothetical protein
MHNILLSKFTQMVDEEWNALMSYLFGRKIFFEKNLCIFLYLMQLKMMVNKNHLQFDHKSFFNFWKTIYGFKNCKPFSRFKLFIIARKFVRILNLLGIGVCW